MEIKVKSKTQLIGILYTWLTQNYNCIIELKDIIVDQSLYISSCAYPNNTVLLSFSINEKSIGNIINSDDNKSRMNWIEDKCGYIDFSHANLVVNLIENDSKNEDIKKSTPIKITTLSEAEHLYSKFLDNKNTNKILFLFVTYIPDLKYRFYIELAIDKVNLYNKTLTIYSTTPIFNLQKELYTSCIYDYYSDIEESVDASLNLFRDIMKTAFIRCMKVTEEEIQLYVYSNCELI